MTDDSPKAAGVYVSRGVSLRIKNLRIECDTDGSELPPITPQVLLSMCPFWFEIAVNQLDAAESAHSMLIDAKSSGENERVGLALEAEFKASMQAIVAAATAMDALYASVREYVSLPADLISTWTANRTARYKQVAEVLRRGFVTKPRGVENLRRFLKELYRFRDLAVHPPGTYSAPILHPDVGAGTEWRFVAFTASNAHQLVRGALAFSVLLATRLPDDVSDGFETLAQGIVSLLDPLVVEWKERYGSLTDEDEDIDPGDTV